jgi:hypothetical protein
LSKDAWRKIRSVIFRHTFFVNECRIRMNLMKSTTLLIAAMACLLTVAVKAEEPATTPISPEDHAFFEKEVRPLLVKRCFECHGGSEAAGRLSLASAKGWQQGGDSGPAIVPGKSDESLLIQAINYVSWEMPPAERGGKLPDDEIAILTKWVEMGAPDPRTGSEVLGGMTLDEAKNWWAFQPLPELPIASADEDTKRIDDFLLREIESRGLKLAPEADRRTLLRRLSYDLTGFPPTHEEVEAFVADPSPDALSKVIDRLLDSPQYGVQWGRRWLDVVRYADSSGTTSDHPLPHAWRYRNWVMEAFHKDMPYDQFVRLQLAGDLLTSEAEPQVLAEGIIATGYLAIARRFGFDSDKDMFLTYEDAIDNLGKSFLGLTISCARCHDHKFDPIGAEDYYALYGILESSRFSFPGCEKNGTPRDLVPLTNPIELEAKLRDWEQMNKQLQLAKQEKWQAMKTAGEGLAELRNARRTVLESQPVTEGGSVPFERSIYVKKGDVLELAVSPNNSHGADTTMVQWQITETEEEQRAWNISDVVPKILQGNPIVTNNDGQWYFSETTNGSVLLTNQRRSMEGNPAIQGWSIDDLPAVFVNTTNQQVMVWTTLAAESFFMHPAHNRPVAVSWISPVDGELRLSGLVGDAHPSGGDGVAFELSHIASPEYGLKLVKNGENNQPLPEAAPKPEVLVAYAVVDGEPKNARFQERGEPEKLGEEVPRRWLSVFGGEEIPAEAGSGRRELSDWIAEHPLTARVMVNRIWQWHFGQGLVRTASDFGTRGDAPTHPELLDFLATRFVQSGYSIKSMHRLILQTNAYRRASATPVAEDASNQYLAHFNRRRLTAEELRDSLLTASGQLDLSPGAAHPFPEEKDWKFSQHYPFNAVYETNKRSAFMMVQRQRRHPFLALFDGADPNASTANRQTTTVPTQALYFINDPFFHAQAASLASTLLEDSDDNARLTQVYRRLFQREPNETEIARCQKFLASYPGDAEQKWSGLSRILLASNEHLHVD